MAWYTKDYSYPVPRWKFPFRLKDENGKSYTGENAFNNRAKLGWIDVDAPPTIDPDTQRMYWRGDAWMIDPIPESEFLAANTAAWVRIREERDDMLQSSDWSQMPVSGVVINTINISSNSEISLAVGDTITSDSITGSISRVVEANTSAAIIKVSVGSDISEGATITFNSNDMTFDRTADSVTSSAAYGYHDSYTDASAEWATYRQELRDLPSTTANAHAIVWPTHPDAAE